MFQQKIIRLHQTLPRCFQWPGWPPSPRGQERVQSGAAGEQPGRGDIARRAPGPRHWPCTTDIISGHQMRGVYVSTNLNSFIKHECVLWLETRKGNVMMLCFKDRTRKPNTCWANAILMARYVSLNSHNLCKSRLILLWWICMPCATA